MVQVFTNVTGWNDLMQGNMFSAAFNALNVPTGGALIFILYIVVSLVLWTRTGSIELCAIISLLFLGVFLLPAFFNPLTMGAAILITAFELGLTLFNFVAKERVH